MTTYLLDSNLVIALSVQGHTHHNLATRWFAEVNRFALCPITEGALVRFLIRQGASNAATQKAVEGLHQRPGFQWWPDSISYLEVDLTHVMGHRQVTDWYLAQLARKHQGKLATLDQGLAQSHPDVVHKVL
ncbi:MAG: PIN domain-containing protein [Bifidobacteriaceae bacterium]|jgi:predicted nucleic acid-binding protein|nr:PIN domain-containing protein [Bifidobacteriaceae bacterium]